MLERALEAAELEDWRTALSEALAAWRAWPAAKLAETIDQLSARAAETRPSSLVGSSDGHRWRLWQQTARAGEPATLRELCIALTYVRRIAQIVAGCELMESHGPDPRIGLVAISTLERSNHRAFKSAQHRATLWKILLRNPHPAALAHGRVIVAPEWIQSHHMSLDVRGIAGEGERVGPQIDEAEGGLPVLPSDDARRCDMLLAASKRTTGRARRNAVESQLLAQIYAAPLDDGPRAIYGDFLQDQGDLRGELIALQLKPHRDGRQRQRIRNLIAAFDHEWRTPVPRETRQVEYRGGFPAIARGLSDVDADPAWATLRSIDVVPSHDEHHLSSLLELVLRSTEIPRLADRKKALRVERLAWSGLRRVRDDWHAESAAAIAAYEMTSCLPALRHLTLGRHAQSQELTVEHFRWLFRAPLFAQLESVRLPSRFIHALDTMYQVEATHVRVLTIDAYSDGATARLRFSRDSANRFRTLTIENGSATFVRDHSALLAWVQQTQHHFTSIRCGHSTPAAVKQLVKQLVRTSRVDA